VRAGSCLLSTGSAPDKSKVDALSDPECGGGTGVRAGSYLLSIRVA
jgi:hypothetical protein